MRKIYCDICGKELKGNAQPEMLWNKYMHYDLDNDRIEDICTECFLTLHCCLIMMKTTGWRPDFHEKLNSKDIWESDKAGYVLSELQDRTGLKLF